MKRQSQHFKSIFFWFLTPASVLIILLSLTQLRITSINCQIETQPCPENIQLLFRPVLGQSIFFSNLEALLNTQLQDQSFQLIKINKRLPSQLTIWLRSIDPIYNLQFSDKTQAVDLKGNLLAQQLSNLPTMIVQTDCPIMAQPQQLDQKIHFQLIQLWQQFQVKQLKPERVNCISSDLVLIKITGQPQFLLDLANLATQTQKLLIVISSLKLETFNPSIQEVDLRFNQPVLRENLTVSE